MDKKSFNKSLEKIMKNKKIGPLIIALLLVLLVYFALSYFIDVNNISKNEKPNEQLPVAGGEQVITKEDYEEEQKKELETILGQISGVGKVNVQLAFEGSEEKIPATNNKKQTSKIEETDTSGGKKNTEQETEDEQVVVTSGSKGDEPLILKISKPKVSGVIITAEGAEDPKIKYDITKAVANLYDISLEKVNVFSMESK
ncbi:MAG: stage III sporulation protein AG [Sarcina sp.]